jgi:hypothetical protein
MAARKIDQEWSTALETALWLVPDGRPIEPVEAIHWTRSGTMPRARPPTSQSCAAFRSPVSPRQRCGWVRSQPTHRSSRPVCGSPRSPPAAVVMKLLAAAEPLCLQVHPTSERASGLPSRTRGTPLDARAELSGPIPQAGLIYAVTLRRHGGLPRRREDGRDPTDTRALVAALPGLELAEARTPFQTASSSPRSSTVSSWRRTRRCSSRRA